MIDNNQHSKHAPDLLCIFRLELCIEATICTILIEASDKLCVCIKLGYGFDIPFGCLKEIKKKTMQKKTEADRLAPPRLMCVMR